MALTTTALAKRLLKVLTHDRDETLLRVDAYLHGVHADPYMPDTADAEYKLLAKRAVTNIMPLLISTPAQACYVDGFRRGYGRPGEARVSGDAPEWDHWQRNGLDSKQSAIYRGAFAYGHSFVLNEKKPGGKLSIRGLSALRTSALYDDPANDIDPVAALHVIEWPTDKEPGRARMWDATSVYDVTWKTTDAPSVGAAMSHGGTECPVTRFAASVDLEGRTTGIIEPAIPLNDRINQSVFDLLVAQTYTSFEVRYATGMAPPLVMDAETGEPKLDKEGNPIPVPMDHNARRFLFAEDHEARFGSLPGGPLNGLIESIEMSIRHLAALTQTPPHHILGQIANLSAEALQAAETALIRKVEEFRKQFGESWERVFRIAAQMTGDLAGAEDYAGEVVWRDMDGRSLAVTTDALGKMSQLLGIPQKGLWPRIPGVTQNELDNWEDLYDEADAVQQLGTARRQILPATPRRTATPDERQGALP